MAEVPYDHIEAPSRIPIDGVTAFMPGDPVPLETAQRLGLVNEDTPVIYGSGGRVPEADLPIVIDGADQTETPPADPALVGATPTPPVDASATTTGDPNAPTPRKGR